MEMNEFIRKPFAVQAIQITEENIAEVADFVEGTLSEKHDGSPYILVNRRGVPRDYRAYPGLWMTQRGTNIRFYSEKIFEDQFVQNNDFVSGIVGTLQDVTAVP